MLHIQYINVFMLYIYVINTYIYLLLSLLGKIVLNSNNVFQ